MSGVYANGLEISGKAVNAKTIAAFPDVCFTPPENPATPPGIPVPYPSFGMASDTDKGTSTVKIGGKTVNIKNKSYLTRTSGTEAGCAAKKGLITSKNTGKEYFNSWSSDVKFDSEPVIRFSDLATNNHSSPNSNTVTWLHMAGLSAGGQDCETLLNTCKIRLHQHSQAKCPPGQESEHFIRVGCFQRSRKKNKSFVKWEKYNNQTAPCICMPARKRNRKGGGYQEGKGSKTCTAHNKKTNQEADFFRKQKAKKKKPTLRNAMEKSLAAVAKNDPTIKNLDQTTKDNVIECLRLVMMEYLQRVVRPPKTQTELNAETVGK